MNNPKLASCRPILNALDTHLQQDGFALVSVYDVETRYTASNAGWTTRLQALVREYEPECNCPHCTKCDHETRESLMLEIEMEREKLGHCLRANLTCSLDDAVSTYLTKIRPVVESFPTRIHRLKWDQAQAGLSNWQDTPFSEFHVLKYFGDIRWQDGQLEEAARCYTALLPSLSEVTSRWREDVRHRLDELGRAVRYEERLKVIYWGF